VTPLDAALLDAWQNHIIARLTDPAGRAELARRLLTHRTVSGPKGLASSHPHSSAARPLRSFTLVLRANDRRLLDNNTAGAVPLDSDEIERLCAPIHLPPPGVPRNDAARLLGITPQALSARVRAGHLVKHKPHPAELTISFTTSRPHCLADAPKVPKIRRPHVFYHAPSPTHLVHPVADVQSADWGILNQHLHQRPAHLHLAANPKRPASLSSDATSGGWSQTLHRIVRQLRPDNPTPQYERFEWLCPDCDQFAQRLYWPFRPLTLPVYLGFDFQKLAPELPPDAIKNLQMTIDKQNQPLTFGFTCRQCLKQQFGGQGLTYESSEFTSRPRKGVQKNTWHLFIQRISMNMLKGHEVQKP
jgi:hypothetical protein